MSGPGIARVQAPTPQGTPQHKHVDGFYADKSWVTPPEASNAALKPHLSEDISERKLGEKPLSRDMTVDSEGRRLEGAAARQEMRRRERVNAWRRAQGLPPLKEAVEEQKPAPKNPQPPLIIKPPKTGEK
jgi:hypothetical protein